MPGMFIQIETGSYSFFNNKIGKTMQSHNIYALDECGKVFMFLRGEGRWLPLEEVKPQGISGNKVDDVNNWQEGL